MLKLVKYRTLILATAAACTAALMAPALVGAHVSVSPTEAAADGYVKLDFSVPHGCEGAATTKVIVQLPDEVVSATPQVVAGWDVSTKTGELANPYDNHGETVTEGVREVTWTGGPLEDGLLQVFGMSVRIVGEPGETIYLKTLQECEGGGEGAWIEIPANDGDEPEMPAPAVTLIDAADTSHGEADENPVDDTSTAETPAAAEKSSQDDSGLSIAALVLGAGGLLTGGLALFRGRKSA